MSMRHIVLKGSPGAGKSTLAAELAKRCGLVHIELDALHHGPNWSAPGDAEFRARVRQALDDAPDGWVVDGNYDSKLGDLVIGRADAIVWLDLPFLLKLRRIWGRTIDRIRHDRELWNGNKETWRGAFLSRNSLFVWMIRVHVRHRRDWPEKFGADPRLIRIRTQSQLSAWLETWVSSQCASASSPSGSTTRV